MRILFYLIITLSFTAGFSTNASTLSIETYIDKYLENSEVLQAQKAQAKVAESQWTISSDLWAAQLVLTPSSYQANQDYTLRSTQAKTSYSDSYEQLAAEWNQALPKGLELSVLGTQTLSGADKNADGLDREFSGTLSLELWNNFIGSKEDALIASSKAAFDASQLQLNNTLIDECHNAVKTYVDSATTLEKSKIYQLKFETAQEAYKVAKRAYNQRLIREIDLISAQGDQISSETEYSEQKHDATNIIYQLNLEAALEPAATLTSELSLPSETQINIDLPSDAWKKSLELSAQQQEAAAKTELAKYEKYNNRSSLKLGSTVGVKDGRQTTSSGLSDYEENYTRVFLKWDLPLNNSNRARVLKAEAESQIANAELKNKQQSVEMSFIKYSEERLNILKKLEASRKKSKIFEKRLNFALKLLRSGKIDYDEYNGYSRAFFEEKVQVAVQLQNLWETTMQLSLLSGEPIRICKEKI